MTGLSTSPKTTKGKHATRRSNLRIYKKRIDNAKTVPKQRMLLGRIAESRGITTRRKLTLLKYMRKKCPTLNKNITMFMSVLALKETAEKRKRLKKV